jgi:membrane-associated phospholipid phosphatase
MNDQDAFIQMNQSVFLWLNSVLTSYIPDWFWAMLTISGHAGMLGAFFSWFLFKRHYILTALFLCALSGGSIGHWLKRITESPRPAAVLPADQFHLIGYKLETISFPSGHSLTSFACAMVLIFGLNLRGWKMLAVLLLAVLISLSRIAVGAHWPIDILAGGTIGIICGYASIKVAMIAHKKFVFLESNSFLWLQAIAVCLSSASLFMTRMGYRIALPWQAIVGLMGVLVPLYFIYNKLLPQYKQRKK